MVAVEEEEVTTTLETELGSQVLLMDTRMADEGGMELDCSSH